MKNLYKFLGAAMLFCFMMLSTVDATAQQSKTTQLKQMYEQAHDEVFTNGAEARLAFSPTATNVAKWGEVVDYYELNNTSANQMAILNEFYDKLSTRAQQ